MKQFFFLIFLVCNSGICLLSVSAGYTNDIEATRTFFIDEMMVIRHVPDDYPTIQSAINNSEWGDTIIIGDGIYTGPQNRELDYRGKCLTITSENGPETCVIDCERQNRGVTFLNGEDERAVLNGVTIRNGLTSGYSDDGGAIYCYHSSPTIMNCIFDRNSSNDHGGGISLYGSSPIIQSCIFTNNIANHSAGGVYCYSQSNPLITDCMFIANQARDVGGAIWCDNTYIVNINNCIFQENQSIGIGGGALSFYRASVSIWNCSLLANTATGRGGGLYAMESNSIKIKDTVIQGNIARGYGGGISFINTDPTISNSIISENTSTKNGGGALFDHSSANLSRCEITSNYSDESGGGFYSHSGTILLTNSVVNDNRVPDHGAGIYGLESQVETSNCLIARNHAGLDGGGICLNMSQITMINCTVVNNNARDGGGIAASGFPEISTCIFWSNFPNQIDESGLPLITYSNIQGGFEGDGNIDADPCFVFGPRGDYYLSQILSGQTVNSPCLDSGNDLAQNICFNENEDNICLNELTTRTDQIPDDGIVDIGYHFIETESPLPTYTPEPTASPVPSSTPSPNTTNSPTSTISPSATPTIPSYDAITVRLWMPSKLYRSGDLCSCKVSIYNPGPDTYHQLQLFVILDILGTYFYAPSYTHFDFFSLLNIAPETYDFQILPEFYWPENTGSARGIIWYAGLTNPEITELISNLDTWAFGWEE